MPHQITLSQAITMTKKFRQDINSILLPIFTGKYKVPKSETFDGETVMRLLSQPGCKSLRIYYGMKDSQDIHAILVGVDENDKDMLGSITELSDNLADPIILDESVRCPDNCPPPSPLNTD